MAQHTFCRQCEGHCGLLAQVEGAHIVELSGDPDDPASLGYCCPAAMDSVDQLGAEDRLLMPHDSQGQLALDAAIARVGRRLSEARAGGGDRVGLYLGRRLAFDQVGGMRALAFGVAMGTSEVYGGLLAGAEARLQAAEAMLGLPIPLQADVERAQTVVLCGADPELVDWGPLQRGMRRNAQLRSLVGGRLPRLFVAGARAPSRGEHLPIRPGTETFLFVGLLSAIVGTGSFEAQYVRDHTIGFDALRRLIEDWPVARCAEACGVEAASISGAALRFCRAPTAVIHPGHGTFSGIAPEVGAWAWLAIHAVTGHLLRPGGLFDHRGIFDLMTAAARVPTAKAPRNAAGRQLRLLMAPASDVLRALQERALDVLVVVQGDPVTSLPGFARALGNTPLVVLDTHTSATTKRAQLVLPVAAPWERLDVDLLDASLHTAHMVAQTEAVVPPPPGVLPTEELLRQVLAATRIGVRGSSHGMHMSVPARLTASMPLQRVWDRLSDMAPDVDLRGLQSPPHRVALGEADRATWRPRTPGQRIVLVPDSIEAALRRLRVPEGHRWLRTSARIDRSTPGRGALSPGIRVHPDSGIAQGPAVVRTDHGAVHGEVGHDSGLRPDAVDVPWGYDIDVNALLGPIDPATGAIVRDGIACTIEPG